MGLFWKIFYFLKFMFLKWSETNFYNYSCLSNNSETQHFPNLIVSNS